MTLQPKDKGILEANFDNFKEHGIEADTKKCKYPHSEKDYELEKFDV